MKGMASAKEFFDAPPIGTYKCRLTSTEATAAQASGTSMIKISGEVIEPDEHAGATFFDNILTDGAAKGAGFGKKKLRGLGIDVDTDAETPDEEIAAKILGVETYITFDHEPMMSKNQATGKYDVPRTNVVDGRQVQVMKLVVKEYLGAVNTAPATSVAVPVVATTVSTPTEVAGAPAASKPSAAVPPWKKAKEGAPAAAK